MLRGNYNTNFDCVEPEQIEDKNVDNFMDELNKLFKKYNLSISHEDGQGCFLIEEYEEYNIKWLNAARINFKE